MAEQEINRFTKKRLELRRRRERRRKIISGVMAVCFTGLLACGIGLFCRFLLERDPIGDMPVMAETVPASLMTQTEAAGITETEPVAELETEAAWAADELSELGFVYSIFVNQQGWNMPHQANSFCMAPAGAYPTALKIRLENQPAGMTGTIEYNVNVSGNGWQGWTDNNTVAGVTETEQPVEAMRARFTGELGEYYDLYYSVLQDAVWTDWVKNGEDAGIEGAGKRVDGIRISSIKKADEGIRFPGGVDPSRPMIALTYDDGPYWAVTPRILDTLTRNNARATFFMVGSRIGGNREIVRQMQEQGSEVANHTMNHVAMKRVTADQYTQELMGTNQLVMEACGITPVLMRPCEGYVNESGMAVVASIGMSGVLWTIDTLDWKHRDVNQTVEAVIGKVKDGDIILMHDLYETTADATEIIVPELIAQGYQLVTVSELAAYRGGVLPGAKYGSFKKIP